MFIVYCSVLPFCDLVFELIIEGSSFHGNCVMTVKCPLHLLVMEPNANGWRATNSFSFFKSLLQDFKMGRPCRCIRCALLKKSLINQHMFQLKLFSCSNYFWPSG